MSGFMPLCRQFRFHHKVQPHEIARRRGFCVDGPSRLFTVDVALKLGTDGIGQEPQHAGG